MTIYFSTFTFAAEKYTRDVLRNTPDEKTEESKEMLIEMLEAAEKIYEVLMACGDLRGKFLGSALEGDESPARNTLLEAVARTGNTDVMSEFLANDGWDRAEFFLHYWIQGVNWD